MDSNLEHEDLLIKLRAKLNEEKIKLWEPPYTNNEKKSLQELARQFSQSLNIEAGKILVGLQELQQHSIDRLRDNEQYKETGQATFRVRASGTGERQAEIKITKPLSVSGEELISYVAESLSVQTCRVKLIHSGKVIKPNCSLEEQGVKNGALMMALIMAETPEQLQAEDSRYTEMKTILEDAMLLSEYVADDDDDEDDYMKLEDQTGREVSLPAAERRALMVGLALHERGRAAAAARDHALALLLLLEADRQFESCGSATLAAVDNWAALQLDVVWSYVRLRQLRAAPDAAARLQRAAQRLRHAYGDRCSRVLAVKGNAENERVMFCRLYLLQGVVAYHQNRRDDSVAALRRAREELDALRVNETEVSELVSRGWSAAQARWGLRAGGGLEAAHARLLQLREDRQRARTQQRDRRLGVCADGSAVSGAALRTLLDMGFPRARALAALRNVNNNVADAARLIHDHPEMLESGDEGGRSDAGSSDESLEPDSALVAELVSMGYEAEAARAALAHAHNRLDVAVTRLLLATPPESDKPGTSGESARKRLKREKKKRRKEREAALARLRAGIAGDEEDYLGASLSDEERLHAHYSALL